MRIFEHADYDFLKLRKTGYIISGVLMLIALVSLITPGLEAGIDFRGGTEFVVRTATPVDVSAARAPLDAALSSGTEVKLYGTSSDILVRTTAGGDADALQSTVTRTLAETFPGSQPEVQRIDSVGPRFADDLQRGAFFAILGSLLVILVYIFFRFDWRYAIGAVACLAHDVLIVLGLFALFHNLTPFSLQIDQTIIAALLTIVGYSINDTVVVFDRIREYAQLFKTEPFGEVVNRGINSTLSRTLLTSGTTLIVVFVLFLLGGEVLRGFAFALLMGISIGTYSSIFVASPVMLFLREKYPVSGSRRVAPAV